MWVVARCFRRTLLVVWSVARWDCLALAVLTAAGAALPVAIAWVGKLSVDAIVAASSSHTPEAYQRVSTFVAVEGGLVILQFSTGRLLQLLRSHMQVAVANAFNLLVMRKALSLELQNFEDATIYDRMQRARDGSSDRPLRLISESFSVVQQLLTLASYCALLASVTPWAVLILAGASIPTFIAEARLSNESFRMFSWRAPESRQVGYLEVLLTRDTFAKEVKLYGLGPWVMARYERVVSRFFREDRALALRRAAYGLSLGGLSVLAFYACYAHVARLAAAGAISLGALTLYMLGYRQGQAASQGALLAFKSIYEDSLFMSNLFAFIDLPPAPRTHPSGRRAVPRDGPRTIELRGVSFRYSDKAPYAVRDVSITLRPGEKLALCGDNGSGKTTLTKLLLGFYQPTEGQILYDGVDLREYDVDAWRAACGVVFQDFARYQFSVGENIGLGCVRQVEDAERIRRAAAKSGADRFIHAMPGGYASQVGGWFQNGVELSLGEWQKLAIARGFMREDAVLFVLDEPTSSMDPEAEHDLFERFRAIAADRTAVWISHRFSTLRSADRIAVMRAGRLEELGTHEELLRLEGRYAHLFRLQARGYL